TLSLFRDYKSGKKKLTYEQVQYLHEYYTMNQIPESIEI
ncbi:unnamed protein product, partial [Rotaria sp. Silwood1]